MDAMKKVCKKDMQYNKSLISLVALVGIFVVILLTYWCTQKPYGHFDNIVTVMNLITMEARVESNEPDWNPYMDIISEEEVFSGPQITDPKKAASGIVISLRGGKYNYTVGDTIYVDIHVYTFYGTFRPYGGDHIRVRMAEEAMEAYSSGYVLDHGNGSYTGVLKALWEGKPKIFADIVLTREEIKYMYELRRKVPTLRTISAIYKNNKTQESGECLPFQEGLDTALGICNLSSINGGIPYFCQKPVTPGLTCKHISSFDSYEYNRTNVEHIIKTPFWREAFGQGAELQVFIKDKPQMPLRILRYPLCREYDRKKLWQQRSPVGYFYKGNWSLTHCKPARKTKDPECLRGKTVFLYGDSTVRQWIVEFKKRFKCKDNGTFYLETSCWNRELDLTLHYVCHTLPGLVLEGKHGSRALVDLLNLITEGTKPIFIIHIYAHYNFLHHRHFRERIKRLRKNIEFILDKRPDSLILFKGPHAYYTKFRGISDMYAYVYRPILIEELEGLRDKVIYLDYMDMSIAMQVKDIHPDLTFLSFMVDEMMAYIC